MLKTFFNFVNNCSPCWPVSAVILHNYRIILAVGKHIVAQDPLTCRCVYIRIDKSAVLGVIISALEVVQPSFVVVDVATIAEGVEGAEGGGEVAGGGEGVAPGVVGEAVSSAAGGAALRLDRSRHRTALCLLSLSFSSVLFSQKAKSQKSFHQI